MNWGACEHCGAVYRHARPEQRFCSSSCARLFRYHGREMDDGTLRAVVMRCARFILYCGDSRGVTERVLADRVDAFRDLDADDRFRAMVLICKEPGIASLSEADGTSRGSFRFWPKCYAPLNAFTYTDPLAP